MSDVIFMTAKLVHYGWAGVDPHSFTTCTISHVIRNHECSIIMYMCISETAYVSLMPLAQFHVF